MATAMTVVGGTVVRFRGIFSDLTTKDPTDPAAVDFSFAVTGATPTVYRYGIDAELEKDAVGEYHVDVDTTGMAPAGDNVELDGQFDGNADGGAGIQVTDYAKVLVTSPPLPNPFS